MEETLVFHQVTTPIEDIPRELGKCGNCATFCALLLYHKMASEAKLWPKRVLHLLRLFTRPIMSFNYFT